MGVPGRILMNRQQCRHSAPLGIDAPHQVPRTLGRDHHHVNIIRRLNGLEVNAESVRHTENFPGVQVGLDRRLVKFSLRLIGRKNVNPVRALRRLVGRDHDHSVGLRLLRRGPVRVQSNDDFVSTIAQVLRLGVSLAPVAQDCDGLALQGVGVGVFLVINSSHRSSSLHDKGHSPLWRYPVSVTERMEDAGSQNRPVGRIQIC